MKLCRVFLMFMGVAIFTASALSQERNSEIRGITIVSNPSGARIYLQGEYTIRGKTPLRIPYPLSGMYKVFASKYGYENLRTFYNFTPEDKGLFSFRLKPKTRFKAVFRSFIFPGWGQWYSDRKLSGSLLGMIEVGLIAKSIDAHFSYRNMVDDYNMLVRNYGSRRYTYSERVAILQKIRDYEHRIDNKYNERKKWVSLAATFWVYNIFDALFYFGYQKLEISHQKVLPSLSASKTKHAFSLNWSFRF